MKGEKKIKVGFNKIVFTSTITIIALLIAVCNCYAASTVIFKYDINNNQEIEEDDAIKILKHIVAKKTNKNKEWLIDEDINLNSFLDVLRYIEANNEENIKEEWLSLKEEIILNVKSREENLNLTTNNEVKIQIDGKNYGEPKYESQNTSIAEVNKLGVITAKEKGSTIITVYDEKQLINETIRVNVNDDSETLKISKDNLILDISDYNTEKLEIEGNVQGTLIWSSSDDKIATVGTINLDYRSLYLNFECGLYMEKVDEIVNIKKDIEETILKSHQVTEKESTPSFLKGIWQAILRLIAPLM